MQEKALILFLISAAAGCTGASEGGIAPGERVVTGRILVDADGATQRQALQVAAVFAAADCAATGAIRVGDVTPETPACAIFGDPFDPGVQGGGVTGEPFTIALPCAVTVNLLVQTLGSSGGQTPGAPLALLAYPTGVTADEVTTLLAREDPARPDTCRDTELLATNLIDLGDVPVPAAPAPDAPPLVLVGGPAGGENPLGTVDTDGDGTANAADPDDDGDLIDDALDDDRDSDGLADAAQTFAPSWL